MWLSMLQPLKLIKENTTMLCLCTQIEEIGQSFKQQATKTSQEEYTIRIVQR